MLRMVLLRVAIMGGLILCAGCLLVPIPSVEVNSRVVDAQAVRFIEPGKTTREEVLLRLGAPESTSAAEDVFFYESEYRSGVGLVMVPICASKGQKARTSEIAARLHHVKVEIVFDANARVRSVNIERGEAKK